MNHLYYGDNSEILKKYITDETAELCYIDPPFNSKRTYNQIYNNIGREDKAQAQAFVDTWTWDDRANEGFDAIIQNSDKLMTTQMIELMIGLSKVLGRGSLLAYLVSMTQRIAQIWRVLKPTGSLYLHCDPTCSHYLKLLLDAIFAPRGGEMRNEIVWAYSRMAAKGQKQLSRCHDIIFWYSKGNRWIFNVDEIRLPYSEKSKAREGYKKTNLGGGSPKSEICELNELGKFPEDWIQIPFIRGREYLGYPTQKPEALLERIINASSNEGDLVLDAYCGCGTSASVAQRLNRTWIGIDITYQSIGLILRRLEQSFGAEIFNKIVVNGIPKDIESARALAHKKDDRLRKEFEKWAILTYSDNRAMINEKKGADRGIDGIAFVQESGEDFRQIIFSVKSGKNVGVTAIRELGHVVQRENAVMGILITLEPPGKVMIQEAKEMGMYHHPLINQAFQKLQIVSIEEILHGKRLAVPLVIEVLKRSKALNIDKNLSFEWSTA